MVIHRPPVRAPSDDEDTPSRLGHRRRLPVLRPFAGAAAHEAPGAFQTGQGHAGLQRRTGPLVRLPNQAVLPTGLGFDVQLAV